LGRGDRDPESIWLSVRKSLKELSRVKSDGHLAEEIYLFVKSVDEYLGVSYRVDMKGKRKGVRR